ncbi:MAG: GDP-mannose 4,6-dehydratase [Thermaerobacter sp.]|nr:GDP-mannose 4,6-dehydratase [Thermaerobacter sp.]
MNVLVTGASGFVGRELVQALSGRGHAVWGVGRNSLDELPSGLLRYHCGDLASDTELESFIREARPDSVVHLAGQASVAASWKDTSDTIDSSVVGSVNLFLTLRRTAAPVRVFVNIGSAEEYAPSDEPLTEDSAIGPSNPYGITKVAQARMLRLLCEDASIPFVHFRPFNHIGPGQHTGFAIPDWASQIAQGTRETTTITVGNLQAIRDFTDVRDIVRAYVSATEGGMPEGEYNLSSGFGRTLRSVLEDLIGTAGVKAGIVVDRDRFRPEDTPTRIGDSDKIRRLTGWKPEIPWEATLRDTLEWFRKA